MSVEQRSYIKHFHTFSPWGQKPYVVQDGMPRAGAQETFADGIMNKWMSLGA